MLDEICGLATSPLLAVILAEGLPAFMRHPLFPIALMFLVMYLLFWAPEKRKRSAVDSMQRELAKNDKVVTIGGIVGTVVNTTPEEVTIRVDDGNNTKIRMLRNAIAQRRDESSSGSSEKDKD